VKVPILDGSPVGQGKAEVSEVKNRSKKEAAGISCSPGGRPQGGGGKKRKRSPISDKLKVATNQDKKGLPRRKSIAFTTSQVSNLLSKIENILL